MEQKAWRERISYRSDLVARVTHLTGRNAKDDDGAFQMLWQILSDKKLIASGQEGYIIGDKKAVCFQEVPLTAMAENLLFEERLGTEKRYLAFGIRVNKGWFYKQGGRPAIYGEKEQLKRALPANLHWRIVSIDLDDPNGIVDWMHEREWRITDDFSFEWSDIEILVKDHNYYRKLVKQCIDAGKIDLLKSIHGIITLDSVIS